MADDYRVKPLEVQAGSIPKAGQIADYLDEDGDLYTCQLMWVGDKVPGHPRRLQCSAVRIQNGYKDRSATSLVSNPVAVLRDGWIFDLDLNCVKWCPCAPPFPDHCP